MIVYGLIPLFPVAEKSTKASHGLRSGGVYSVEFEDVSELTGRDQGHAETVGGRRCSFQLRVNERYGGVLDSLPTPPDNQMTLATPALQTGPGPTGDATAGTRPVFRTNLAEDRVPHTMQGSDQAPRLKDDLNKPAILSADLKSSKLNAPTGSK